MRTHTSLARSPPLAAAYQMRLELTMSAINEIIIEEDTFPKIFRAFQFRSLGRLADVLNIYERPRTRSKTIFTRRNGS